MLKRKLLRYHSTASVIFTGLIGAIFTVSLSYIAFHHSYEVAKADVDAQSIAIKDNMALKFNVIEESAYGIRTLYYASDEVDSDEFRIMSDLILSRHEYISSLVFLDKTPTSERSSFELGMIDDGFVGFNIKDLEDEKFVASPRRTEYYPAIFFEPFLPESVKYLGFDYLSVDSFRQAIKSAIESSKVKVSFDVMGEGYVAFIAVYAGKSTPVSIRDRRQSAVGVVAFHIKSPVTNTVVQGFDLSLSLYHDEDAQYQRFLSNEMSAQGLASKGMIDHVSNAYVLRLESELLRLTTRSPLLWSAIDIRYLMGAVVFGLFVTLFAVYQVRSIILRSQLLYRQTKALEALNFDLKSAQYRAEESNRLKSEFLSNMSHELRTPLHAVIGFCELGEACHSSWTTEEQIENLSEIKGSGQQLLGLINNLMDLSTLESGASAFTIESVGLKRIANAVVQSHHSSMKEKRVTVDVVGEDCDVACDEEKIFQVIDNLLSNAIQFSPKDATIMINVERCSSMIKTKKHPDFQQEGGVFSIIDQGVGIPENEHIAVFDKFIQSSKTKTGAGGTGLGLAICAEIIEGHGGIIWLENNPRGGAIFSFVLPLPV